MRFLSRLWNSFFLLLDHVRREFQQSRARRALQRVKQRVHAFDRFEPLVVLNADPVALDDVYTAEDFAAPFDPTLNDTDADGDALEVVGIRHRPSGGTLTWNENGSFSYTPKAGFVGEDWFQYDVSDGISESRATVWLEVGPPMVLSGTNDGDLRTMEETPVDLRLTRTHFQGVAMPYFRLESVDGEITHSNGTPVGVGEILSAQELKSSGFRFTPAADRDTTAAIVLQGMAGASGSVTVGTPLTFEIAVEPVADTPRPQDDYYELGEDVSGGLSVAVDEGLLANDFDPDSGDALEIVPYEGVTEQGNWLSLQSNGSFTFVPNADFCGTDSFTYTIIDQSGAAVEAVLTFSVQPVNDAPLSTPGESRLVHEEQRVSRSELLDWLGVTDVDDDLSTLTISFDPVGGDTYGTLTYDAAADEYVYTPNGQGLIGSDAYLFSFTDPLGLTTQALATFEVVDQGPTAVPATGNWADHVEQRIGRNEFLSRLQVTDGDDDPSTLTIDFTPVDSVETYGTLTYDAATDEYVYTPTGEGLIGSDAYLFTFTDPLGLSTQVQATFEVQDLAPTATAAEVTVSHDRSLSWTGDELRALLGAADEDGDSLTISYAGGDAVGTLSFDGIDTYTYQADADLGDDVYSITFTDPLGLTVTVDLTVHVVNRAPTGSSHDYEADEDTVLTAPFPTASDLDEDAVTFRLVEGSGPSYGTLEIVGGEFVYTPGANYNGPDSFRYVIDDGLALSDEYTVDINVLAAEDAPLASMPSMRLDYDRNATPIPLEVELSEVDDGLLSRVTVTIVGYQMGDQLNPPADGDGISWTFDAVTGVLTGVGNVGYDVYQNHLNGTTFSSVGAPGLRTLVLVPRDTSGVDGDPASRDVYVHNQAPTLISGASVPGLAAQVEDEESAGTRIGDFFDPALNTEFATDANSDVLGIALTGTDDANGHWEFLRENESTWKAVDNADDDMDANGSAPVSETRALLLGPADRLRFVPNQDYNGPAGVHFRLWDRSNLYVLTGPYGDVTLNDPETSYGADTVETGLTVEAVNDPPVAHNLEFTINEDQPLSRSVTADDVDMPVNPYIDNFLVDQPSHGTVTLDIGGGFTYTPHPDYSGPDSFTYYVNDGELDSEIATVTINVTAVNDAPLAGVRGRWVMTADGNLGCNASLDSETHYLVFAAQDNDGKDFSYVLGDGSLMPSGTLVYLEGAGGEYALERIVSFAGRNSYGTYTYVSEYVSGTYLPQINDLITVTFGLNPKEFVDEDGVLNASVAGFDLDHNDLRFTPISGPANGVLTFNNNDGTYTYTPNADFFGPDSFTFQVDDGTTTSPEITVAIDVVGINEDPRATLPAETIHYDRNATPILYDLGLEEVDGENLSRVTVTIEGYRPGDVLGTPQSGEGIVWSFDVETGVLMGDGEASVDTYLAHLGAATFSSVGLPGSRTLVVAAWDATGHGSQAASRTVIVHNHAPTSAGVTSIHAQMWQSEDDLNTAGTSVRDLLTVGRLPSFAADADGDDLGIALLQAPFYSGHWEFLRAGASEWTDVAHADGPDGAVISPTRALLLHPDDRLRFVPAYEDFTGTRVAAFRLWDRSNALELTGPYVDATVAGGETPYGSTYRTIHVTMIPVNDPPTAADYDGYVIDEEVLLNASLPDAGDVEGNSVTYHLVDGAGPSRGTLDLSENGSFTYTPDPDFSGTDSFRYVVNDGLLDSVEYTVTITVAGKDDVVIPGTWGRWTATGNRSTGLDVSLDGPIRTLSFAQFDADGKDWGYQFGDGTTLPIGTLVQVVNRADETWTLERITEFVDRGNDGASYQYKVEHVSGSYRPQPGDDVSIVFGTAPIESVDEDGELQSIVSAIEIDRDPLTFTLISGASHGELTFDNGNYTYIPYANFSGTDSFTYTVDDGTTVSEETTVTIIVNKVNDAPVVNPDADFSLTAAAVGDDTQGVTITELLRTSDVVALPASVTDLNAAATLSGRYLSNHDSAVGGTFDFAADALDAWLGTAQIHAIDADGQDHSIVMGDNLEANSLLAFVDEFGRWGAALLTYNQYAGNYTANLISSSGVFFPLSGDERENTSFRVWIVSPSAEGYDELVSDFRGVPGAWDVDGDAVGVALTGVDASSGAWQYQRSNDSVWHEISANDLSDGHAFHLRAADRLRYVPELQSEFPVSIQFRLWDGSNQASLVDGWGDYESSELTTTDAYGNGSVLAANIPVLDGNHAPEASDGLGFTTEDEWRTDEFPAATDEDGDALTYHKVSGPSHGQVTIEGNTFTYTPAADFNGTDWFTYRVYDGETYSNDATITISVSELNDAPRPSRTFTGHWIATQDGNAGFQAVLTGSPRYLLFAQDDRYGVNWSSQLGNGSGLPVGALVLLVNEADGRWSLERVVDFVDRGNGAAYRYQVEYDSGEYQPAPGDSISFTFGLIETMNEDGELAGAVSAADPDGDPLTFNLTGDVAHGELDFDETTGSYVYTPDANFSGVDSFRYTVNDGTEVSEEAEVVIVVKQINDAPTAEDGPGYIAYEDLILTAGFPQAVDLDGDSLTYVKTSDPSHGALTVSGSTFTYIPNANFQGTDSFRYQVTDGLASSPEYLITISVNVTNSTPVIDAAHLTVAFPTVNEDSFEFPTKSVRDLLQLPLPMTVAELDAVRPHGSISTAAGFDIWFNPYENKPATVLLPAQLSEDAVAGSLLVYRDGQGNWGSVLLGQPQNGGFAATHVTSSGLSYAPTLAGAEGNRSYTAWLIPPSTSGYQSALDAFFGAELRDVDGDSIGIAIVGLDAGTMLDWAPASGDIPDGELEVPTPTTVVGGQWEYSLNGGATWEAVLDGELQYIDDSHALVLPIDALLRFVPRADFDDPVSLNFRLWDGTDGAGAGDRVNVTSIAYPQFGHSATSAYSSAIETATLMIVSVNDAPMIYGIEDGDAGLTSIYEDDFNSAGDTINELLAGFNDCDIDGDVLGIAVVGVSVGTEPLANVPGGHWEFKRVGDSQWSPFGTVNDGSALLLSGNAKVRFVPAPNFHGEVDFAFRLWDRTAGVEPNRGDATANGGTAAYSDGVFTAGLHVNAVNDAPTTTAAQREILDVTPRRDNLNLESNYRPQTWTVQQLLDRYNVVAGGIQDIDLAAWDGEYPPPPFGIGLIGQTNGEAGTWFYSVDGGEEWGSVADLTTGRAILLANDALVQFVASAAGEDFAGLQFRIWDGSDDCASGADVVDVHGSTGSLSAQVCVVQVDVGVLRPDGYGLAMNQTLTVTAENGVTTNDEMVTLQTYVVTQPEHGTLVFNELTGAFTYTPNLNFKGYDQFRYASGLYDPSTDPERTPAITTVAILVYGPNEAPSVAPQTLSVNEDETVELTLSGTDPENSPLTLAIVSQPVHGTLISLAGGGYKYTPDPDFFGTDEFSYQAFDGAAYSAPATVTINVQPVNDEPTASGGQFLVDNHSPTSRSVSGDDPEHDALTYQLGDHAQHGVVTLAANGTFTYTPNSGYTGPDTFSYKSFDGNKYSEPAIVTLIVMDLTTTVEDYLSDADHDGDAAVSWIENELASTAAQAAAAVAAQNDDIDVDHADAVTDAAQQLTDVGTAPDLTTDFTTQSANAATAATTARDDAAVEAASNIDDVIDAADASRQTMQDDVEAEADDQAAQAAAALADLNLGSSAAAIVTQALDEAKDAVVEQIDDLQSAAEQVYLQSIGAVTNAAAPAAGSTAAITQVWDEITQTMQDVGADHRAWESDARTAVNAEKQSANTAGDATRTAIGTVSSAIDAATTDSKVLDLAEDAFNEVKDAVQTASDQVEAGPTEETPLGSVDEYATAASNALNAVKEDVEASDIDAIRQAAKTPHDDLRDDLQGDLETAVGALSTHATKVTGDIDDLINDADAEFNAAGTTQFAAAQAGIDSVVTDLAIAQSTLQSDVNLVIANAQGDVAAIQAALAAVNEPEAVAVVTAPTYQVVTNPTEDAEVVAEEQELFAAWLPGLKVSLEPMWQSFHPSAPSIDFYQPSIVGFNTVTSLADESHNGTFEYVVSGTTASGGTYFFEAKVHFFGTLVVENEDYTAHAVWDILGFHYYETGSLASWSLTDSKNYGGTSVTTTSDFTGTYILEAFGAYSIILDATGQFNDATDVISGDTFSIEHEGGYQFSYSEERNTTETEQVVAESTSLSTRLDIEDNEEDGAYRFEKFESGDYSVTSAGLVIEDAEFEASAVMSAELDNDRQVFDDVIEETPLEESPPEEEPLPEEEPPPEDPLQQSTTAPPTRRTRETGGTGFSWSSDGSFDLTATNISGVVQISVAIDGAHYELQTSRDTDYQTTTRSVINDGAHTTSENGDFSNVENTVTVEPVDDEPQERGGRRVRHTESGAYDAMIARTDAGSGFVVQTLTANLVGGEYMDTDYSESNTAMTTVTTDSSNSLVTTTDENAGTTTIHAGESNLTVTETTIASQSSQYAASGSFDMTRRSVMASGGMQSADAHITQTGIHQRVVLEASDSIRISQGGSVEETLTTREDAEIYSRREETTSSGNDHTAATSDRAESGNYVLETHERRQGDQRTAVENYTDSNAESTEAWSSTSEYNDSKTSFIEEHKNDETRDEFNNVIRWSTSDFVTDVAGRLETVEGGSSSSGASQATFDTVRISTSYQGTVTDLHETVDRTGFEVFRSSDSYTHSIDDSGTLTQSDGDLNRSESRDNGAFTYEEDGEYGSTSESWRQVHSNDVGSRAGGGAETQTFSSSSVTPDRNYSKSTAESSSEYVETGTHTVSESSYSGDPATGESNTSSTRTGQYRLTDRTQVQKDESAGFVESTRAGVATSLDGDDVASNEQSQVISSLSYRHTVTGDAEPTMTPGRGERFDGAAHAPMHEYTESTSDGDVRHSDSWDAESHSNSDYTGGYSSTEKSYAYDERKEARRSTGATAGNALGDESRSSSVTDDAIHTVEFSASRNVSVYSENGTIDESQTIGDPNGEEPTPGSAQTRNGSMEIVDESDATSERLHASTSTTADRSASLGDATLASQSIEIAAVDRSLATQHREHRETHSVTMSETVLDENGMRTETVSPTELIVKNEDDLEQGLAEAYTENRVTTSFNGEVQAASYLQQVAEGDGVQFSRTRSSVENTRTVGRNPDDPNVDAAEATFKITGSSTENRDVKVYEQDSTTTKTDAAESRSFESLIRNTQQRNRELSFSQSTEEGTRANVAEESVEQDRREKGTIERLEMIPGNEEFPDPTPGPNHSTGTIDDAEHVESQSLSSYQGDYDQSSLSFRSASGNMVVNFNGSSFDVNEGSTVEMTKSSGTHDYTETGTFAADDPGTAAPEPGQPPRDPANSSGNYSLTINDVTEAARVSRGTTQTHERRAAQGGEYVVDSRDHQADVDVLRGEKSTHDLEYKITDGTMSSGDEFETRSGNFNRTIVEWNDAAEYDVGHEVRRNRSRYTESGKQTAETLDLTGGKSSAEQVSGFTSTFHQDGTLSTNYELQSASGSFSVDRSNERKKTRYNDVDDFSATEKSTAADNRTKSISIVKAGNVDSTAPADATGRLYDETTTKETYTYDSHGTTAEVWDEETRPGSYNADAGETRETKLVDSSSYGLEQRVKDDDGKISSEELRRTRDGKRVNVDTDVKSESLELTVPSDGAFPRGHYMDFFFTPGGFGGGIIVGTVPDEWDGYDPGEFGDLPPVIGSPNWVADPLPQTNTAWNHSLETRVERYAKSTYEADEATAQTPHDPGAPGRTFEAARTDETSDFGDFYQTIEVYAQTQQGASPNSSDGWKIEGESVSAAASAATPSAIISREKTTEIETGRTRDRRWNGEIEYRDAGVDKSLDFVASDVDVTGGRYSNVHTSDQAGADYLVVTSHDGEDFLRELSDTGLTQTATDKSAGRYDSRTFTGEGRLEFNIELADEQGRYDTDVDRTIRSVDDRLEDTGHPTGWTYTRVETTAYDDSGSIRQTHGERTVDGLAPLEFDSTKREGDFSRVVNEPNSTRVELDGEVTTDVIRHYDNAAHYEIEHTNRLTAENGVESVDSAKVTGGSFSVSELFITNSQDFDYEDHASFDVRNDAHSGTFQSEHKTTVRHGVKVSAESVNFETESGRIIDERAYNAHGSWSSTNYNPDEGGYYGGTPDSADGEVQVHGSSGKNVTYTVTNGQLTSLGGGHWFEKVTDKSFLHVNFVDWQDEGEVWYEQTSDSTGESRSSTDYATVNGVISVTQTMSHDSDAHHFGEDWVNVVVESYEDGNEPGEWIDVTERVLLPYDYNDTNSGSWTTTGGPVPATNQLTSRTLKWGSNGPALDGSEAYGAGELGIVLGGDGGRHETWTGLWGFIGLDTPPLTSLYGLDATNDEVLGPALGEKLPYYREPELPPAAVVPAGHDQPSLVPVAADIVSHDVQPTAGVLADTTDHTPPAETTSTPEAEAAAPPAAPVTPLPVMFNPQLSPLSHVTLFGANHLGVGEHLFQPGSQQNTPLSANISDLFTATSGTRKTFSYDPNSLQLVTGNQNAFLRASEPHAVGSFAKGVLKGFFSDGFGGDLETIADLAGLAFRLGIELIPGGGEAYFWYYGERPLEREITAVGDAVGRVRESLPSIETVQRVVEDVVAFQIDFLNAVVRGDTEKLSAYGSTVNDFLEAGGDVLLDLIAKANNLSPEMKGRVVGYVLYQVAITFATAGAAAAAKAGKVCAIADKLADLKFLDDVPELKEALVQAGRHIQAMLNLEICFVAGTLVHTADGLRPIETVQQGDLVLARPEFDPDGDNVYRPVLATIVTQPQELVHLKISVTGETETLVGTPGHPFFSVDRNEFVAAGELNVGERLALADGRPAAVVALRRESAPAGTTFTTYNLSVAEDRTYFVGKSAVWVHNIGAEWCSTASKHAYKQALKEGSEAAVEAFSEKAANDLARLKPGEQIENLKKVRVALESLPNPPDNIEEVMDDIARRAFGDVGSGLSIRPRRDMPETTRFNTKVYGTAQSTDELGKHARVIIKQVDEMAQSGEYEYILMNRSVRTATDLDVSRLRPDIIGVRKDGKVDVFEVPSFGDTRADLEARLKRALDSLPRERRGDAVVLPTPEYKTQ